MNFDIPEDLQNYLSVLDDFIEAEIKPLENENDNIRFFDHRREDARTDWDRGGLPNEEWEALLGEARRRADKAGHYRYPIPKEYGGQNGSNLGMAVIREHFATKGLGLHNDLQNEHSIVANNVVANCFMGMKAMHGSRNVLINGNQFHKCSLWAIGLMPGAAAHAGNFDGGSIIANS